MTQTEYEQKKRECWEDFWEAIKISRIDCNYWRQLFEDTYHTAFNKGFALAYGKEDTDAVFGEQEKDEVKPTESGRFEPTPAEPKFKVGGKVRVSDDPCVREEFRGCIGTVVYINSTSLRTVSLDGIRKPETFHVSDLEPYTEPTENHFPDPAKMFDVIIKDSFREHNRLHIAAMAMAGMFANPKVVCGRSELKEDRAWIVEMAMRYADALMKAAGEGGGE